MKKIAIIGAGLSGLRAALEFIHHPDFHITIWEKSSSVGGRIATRRFENSFTNHGAEKINDLDRLFQEDPAAKEFQPFFDFSQGATRLPKALKDKLIQSKKVDFHFGNKVIQVTPQGFLIPENLTPLNYDEVLITSPLHQTESILGLPLFPEINYSKKILFIGEYDGKSERLEMSDVWSEINFEFQDSEIRMKAEEKLKRKLEHLQIKKWRYSQVTHGLRTSFVMFSKQVTLAGDAFDPKTKHNATSAWLSGAMAAKFILNK